MKAILILILLSFKANAIVPPDECGLYKVNGKVKIIDYSPAIIINEGSLSELTLSVPISKEPVIIPYVDKYIEISVTINHAFDGTKGSATNLENPVLRIPDPLINPPVPGLTLIKKHECEVEKSK